MTGQSVLACAAVTVDVPGRTLVRDLTPRPACRQVAGRAGRKRRARVRRCTRWPACERPLREVAGCGDASTRGRAANSRAPGLLPQMVDDPFPATALEAVLVRASPAPRFLGPGKAPTTRGRPTRTGCSRSRRLEQRDIATLSGGERGALDRHDPCPGIRRSSCSTNRYTSSIAASARSAADIRRLADAGRTVVVSLHDIALRHALRFGVVVVRDGRCTAAPATRHSPNTPSELYGIPVRELRWEHGRTFVAA